MTVDKLNILVFGVSAIGGYLGGGLTLQRHDSIFA